MSYDDQDHGFDRNSIPWDTGDLYPLELHSKLEQNEAEQNEDDVLAEDYVDEGKRGFQISLIPPSRANTEVVGDKDAFEPTYDDHDPLLRAVVTNPVPDPFSLSNEDELSSFFSEYGFHSDKQCELCQETYENLPHRKKHILKHIKPYKCTFLGCKRNDKGFATLNDRERHTKSVHEEGPQIWYTCAYPKCAKSDGDHFFSRKANFHAHIKRRHEHLKQASAIERLVISSEYHPTAAQVSLAKGRSLSPLDIPASAPEASYLGNHSLGSIDEIGSVGEATKVSDWRSPVYLQPRSPFAAHSFDLAAHRLGFNSGQSTRPIAAPTSNPQEVFQAIPQDQYAGSRLFDSDLSAQLQDRRPASYPGPQHGFSDAMQHGHNRRQTQASVPRGGAYPGMIQTTDLDNNHAFTAWVGSHLSVSPIDDPALQPPVYSDSFSSSSPIDSRAWSPPTEESSSTAFTAFTSVSEAAANTKSANLVVQGPERDHYGMYQGEDGYTWPYSLSFTDFERSVHGLPPAKESFLIAIKQRSVHKAQELLEVAGHSIARNEFEWINESLALGYSAKDVVEALVEEHDPWIYFSQPRLEYEMDPHHHQRGCIHGVSGSTVARDSALNYTSRQEKEVENQALVDSESIKHMIARMCGLAGIIPSSETMTDWNGEYVFPGEAHSTIKIGFSPVRSDSKINWASTIQRVNAAFMAFVSLCGWLQEMRLCCNGYTILVSHEHDSIVEAVPVQFSSIGKLKDALRLVSANESDIESLRNLYVCSTDIMSILRLSQTLMHESLEIVACESLVSKTLQWTAIVVQVLCLGMLSFSQAHVGSLTPFFLEHELDHIGVMGLIMDESKILLEMSLHELTCMGEMLGNRVMAFTVPQKRQGPNDLLVRPEDLLDTWGPGTSIAYPSDDPANLVAISVGGGIIQKHDEQSDLLHWSRVLSNSTPGLSGNQFSGSDPVLIGGRATTNIACPLSLRSLSIPAGIFDHFLGVSKDRWQLCQRQFGGQLGYNYAMMTGNLTWIKTSGTTLKDQIIGNDLDISFIYFLNGPWGLQLSSCTGVAMRVPLREVVADVIDPIIEGVYPPVAGWTDLRDKYRTLEHLCSLDFCDWMKTLPNNFQQSLAIAIRHVLQLLSHTGFDKEEQELVVAYALPNSAPRSLRIPCKDHQHWAKVLKDSRNCATFACLSTKCLQTRTRKCKGLSQPEPSVLRSPALLATAVMQVKMDRQQLEIIASELEVGAEYWFGESVPELKAKVVMIDPGSPTAEVCLHIEQCRIPAHIFKRLRAKQPPARQLMERRDWIIGAAREVLLLDRI